MSNFLKKRMYILMFGLHTLFFSINLKSAFSAEETHSNCFDTCYGNIRNIKLRSNISSYASFASLYYSSSRSIGICLLKASLKDINDSVRAKPNGWSLLWMMLSKCWLFFAYILMKRSYCPVV